MRHSRPNILILITDQQSHELLSCAGTSWVRTPHVDALAAEGCRYARAYCTSPVCIPSRFSLFTGRMPSAIGMRGNGGSRLHGFTPELDRQCLGHQLRSAGYETFYGGKTHWPIGLDPGRMGFTSYSRDEREGLAQDAATLIRSRTGAAPWATVVSLINPHDICYHAIRAFADPDGDGRWLPQARDELAALDEALRPPAGIDPDEWARSGLPPLPANHEPQVDEPEWIERLLARRPFKLRARRAWSDHQWRLHRWAYARLVERVDAQIGRVLDALTASGQSEETLVIFTSDHGDHAGSHRLEHKTFFYDEAARVPWILRWPGRIAAGSVEQRPVSTGLDLLATCCEAAGIQPPAWARGVGALSLAQSRREDVFGENLVSRMVCTATWKYVRYDGGAHADQLYDLVNDPGETRNAWQDPAASGIRRRLSARLDQHLAEHAALALGPLVDSDVHE